MSKKRPEPTKSSSLDDVPRSARTALLQLLKPIAELAVGSGLSIQSLNSIVREVAVRGVAAEHLRVSQRINFSGISASTGIPRGEVARILKRAPNSSRGSGDRKQLSAINKILTVWCKNSRFTTLAGAPADLRIYGRGTTFEALVKTHGGGIPTRAILDELSRKKAIEIRPCQVVRFKESEGLDRRFTTRRIEAFGSHGAKLLLAMLHGIGHPDESVIMKTVSAQEVSTHAIAFVRREISLKGAELFVDIKKILAEAKQYGGRGTSLRGQISFAIVFQDSSAGLDQDVAVEPRRNLRRAL